WLPGVSRLRRPRTAADRRAARLAPAPPQRLDRPALGRPGVSAGLPLVRRGALLGRPGAVAAGATGGTGRGAVAAVLRCRVDAPSCEPAQHWVPLGRPL